MIFIKYTDKFDFEYDIQGIVRSFYPGEEMCTDKSERLNDARLILECAFNSESLEIKLLEKLNDTQFKSVTTEKFKAATDLNGEYDRKETKNILKRKLYDILYNYSGKELLWGTLSGIRPTKITSELLENGMSDEEAIHFMKENYYLSDIKAKESVKISRNELNILDKIDYKNGYSLYVGIPFCPSTCLYCSFTSNPLSKFRNKIDSYLDAVCKEIEFCKKTFAHKKISTIYVGGGTPTTLEPYQLEKLLGKIEECFDVSKLYEFTVEAGRPDSITREKLAVIKKHGVTRISINPQTMKDETLKIIGRHHTVEQFINAYKMAREEGFDNINMDFILGLPDENADDIRYNMKMVEELKPDSLTIHSLALKRAARLNVFKDKYKDYAFENSEEIMEITKETAKRLDLEPYYLYRQKNMTGNLENVGYARKSKEGIYNILIMEEKHTILAVGAGASTKMVFPDGKRIERIENVKDVDLYIEKIDEMIERKNRFIQENECFRNSAYKDVDKDINEDADKDIDNDINEEVDKDVGNDINEDADKDVDNNAPDEIIDFNIDSIPEALMHGICVSNLAYDIGKELGLDDEYCNMLAMAGMVHDIGKVKVYAYLYGGDDTLNVEKLKYIRMHSKLGYDILSEKGFSNDVLEAVLYHHENYDGSGYPENLAGENIPLSARILRVSDVFAALISNRTYRKAFDFNTAIELMIDEVKNFDMKIFLAFMRVIHSVDINKITRKEDIEE
ncbi:MAG: coproporphyrinogen dehydrogenase HemZ [Lachnospiraceae bacterium]|nr:coproporphyrinogen dehydrogenase HemZ [Lachnospiraceae bacterium]